MTDKVDLAYIAGLADGEAYIGIKKSPPYKRLTGRVNPAYQERIQIRMVNERAIRFLAETLGGWYYQEKPSVANGKPLYCYQASDKAAGNILRLLLPYLRVKRPQAKTVLLLRQHKELPRSQTTISLPHMIPNRWGKLVEIGRRRLSKEAVEYRESLYQECKRLNKTGI